MSEVSGYCDAPLGACLHANDLAQLRLTNESYSRQLKMQADELAKIKDDSERRYESDAERIGSLQSQLLEANQERAKQSKALIRLSMELSNVRGDLTRALDVMQQAVTAKMNMSDLSGPVHRIGLALAALDGVGETQAKVEASSPCCPVLECRGCDGVGK